MEVIDPAIETQLLSLLTKLDFTVYNDLKDASKADIKLTGEGFSEFAMRMGNLTSVKARVELKAVNC